MPLYGSSPREIKGEEAFEDLVVGEVVGPGVGVKDGGVELPVGEVKPGGTFVVQVGERPFLQLGLAGAFGI